MGSFHWTNVSTEYYLYVCSKILIILRNLLVTLQCHESCYEDNVFLLKLIFLHPLAGQYHSLENTKLFLIFV
jgi:hypothetical protein